MFLSRECCFLSVVSYSDLPCLSFCRVVLLADEGEAAAPLAPLQTLAFRPLALGYSARTPLLEAGKDSGQRWSPVLSPSKLTMPMPPCPCDGGPVAGVAGVAGAPRVSGGVER